MSRYPICTEPQPRLKDPAKQEGALRDFRHRLEVELDGTRGRGKQAGRRRDALAGKVAKVTKAIAALTATEEKT